MHSRTSPSSVSAVIPCYNVEGCVERAVMSVLAQTHPVHEVICVDDGSTDGTLGVLQRLELAHPVVRVLSGPNGGAPVARNKGLRVASGEYIQFLDADDVLDPDKIGLQVEAATAVRPQADLVVGSYRRVSEDGREHISEVTDGDMWLQLLSKQLGITSANLWRRSFVERVGGWSRDWKSSQEYELMFRMLQHGARVLHVAPIHTTLYERPSSISSGFGAPVRRRYTELRVQILEYLKANDLFDTRHHDSQEVVFRAVRQLYELDPEAAHVLHLRAFPDGYVPPVSGFNTPAYVATYKRLGLRGAERVRKLLGRTREFKSIRS